MRKNPDFRARGVLLASITTVSVFISAQSFAARAPKASRGPSAPTATVDGVGSAPLPDGILFEEGPAKPKIGIKEDEPEEDRKWEEDWKTLCSYDDKWCYFLKEERDSSWKNPGRLQIEVMKLYREEIKKAAKLYGVDPRALAGAFLADLTLTPFYASEIRRYFADRAAAGPGKEPMGDFPLGLVYFPAASSVEELAAKVERRPKREAKDIYPRLQTPEGTILYGAAVLRDAQDLYKSHNWDISKSPEVLATLYNLGQPAKWLGNLEKRIAKAAEIRARLTGEMGAKGASREQVEEAIQAELDQAQITRLSLGPRFNFFGFFIKKNMDVIEGILDPRKEPAKMKYPPADKARCDSEKMMLAAEYSTAQKTISEVKSRYPALLSDFVRGLNARLMANPKAKKAIETLAAEPASKPKAPGNGRATVTDVTGRDADFSQGYSKEEYDKRLAAQLDLETAVESLIAKTPASALASGAASICPPESRMQPAEHESGTWGCGLIYQPMKDGLRLEGFRVDLLPPSWGSKDRRPVLRACYEKDVGLREQVTGEISACSFQVVGDAKTGPRPALYADRRDDNADFRGARGTRMDIEPAKFVAYALPLECVLSGPLGPLGLNAKEEAAIQPPASQIKSKTLPDAVGPASGGSSGRDRRAGSTR